MSARDGGPAFPVVADQWDYGYERVMPKQVEPGMALRDYFAAKAMQGYCAVRESWGETAEVASYAYRIADAMLAARGEP